MNWLAWDRRAYVGAVIGAAVGLLLFGLLEGQGWFAPWVVGISMGLGCAALTQERTGLRGWLVGAAALWISAAAQAHYLPAAPGDGLLDGLLRFHETLTLERLLLHLGGAVAGGFLGATSLHRGARRRAAGA